MENLPKKDTHIYKSNFFRNLRSVKKIELEIEFRLLHLKGSLESVLSKQIKVLQMTDPQKRENVSICKFVLLALFCFWGIIIEGPVNFLALRPSSWTGWLTATPTPLTSTTLSNSNSFSSSSTGLIAIFGELTSLLRKAERVVEEGIFCSIIAWGAGLPGINLCLSDGVTERLWKQAEKSG